MIVFDVIVNGQIQETLQPKDQRLQEMYWFMVDQVQLIKEKYGENFQISKRTMEVYPQ
ncbi:MULTISPECIES: mechanosensitive ion channel protein MscL [Paenibacillus]|uniref:Mechanosensitive ion channel protein MscL n=1 Tax=Paenibacillus radicis (ex Xue et al. 2023) TaxID=2972489 RepID=A0ABT1YNY0_9BACL|nr:mechanosensitive ion channel protein MscL [Paenibacillus radicis (ex Xue et al. 2023)]MCR8634876.1 mechanosensitive ion channel protein MscL [Paenibacillus radicis (ex Xue et al. 2023)]